MSKKRTISYDDVEIDATYEAQIDYLGNMTPEHTSDYAIEPARPEPRPAQRQTLVLPEQRPEQSPRLEITPQEQAFMAQGFQAMGAVVNAPRRERDHSGHTRQNDTAMSHAQASAYYARLYMLVFAGALGALAFLVWYVKGGPLALYIAGYIALLSVCAYWALAHNRAQGLHHSSTGIAHHELEVEVEEISSKERIALGIVDRHIGLLEKKMLIELEMKRLEGKRNG